MDNDATAQLRMNGRGLLHGLSLMYLGLCSNETDMTVLTDDILVFEKNEIDSYETSFNMGLEWKFPDRQINTLFLPKGKKNGTALKYAMAF